MERRGFQEQINKKVIETRRPRKARLGKYFAIIEHPELI